MLAAELVEAAKNAMESIKTILFGKTDDTKVQIARNAVVEGVRYATNMLILWTLTEFVLGKEYLGVSTAIASLLAGLVNYALSSLWVFHKVEKKPKKIFCNSPCSRQLAPSAWVSMWELPRFSHGRWM